MLLLVGVLPMLFTTLPAFRTLVGDGTLLVMVAFAVGALITGHLLGGPKRNNRTVLALSTATRHPGIAIALATANFPDEKLAVPAVLMYVIVSAVVSVPYVAASRRQHDAPAARSATTRRANETPSRQR
jgi:BASS family bile acid:Na+ symporter